MPWDRVWNLALLVWSLLVIWILVFVISRRFTWTLEPPDPCLSSSRTGAILESLDPISSVVSYEGYAQQLKNVVCRIDELMVFVGTDI